MRIGDINLENIKIVIFDFDNTLAIHKDKDFTKHRKESEDKYFGYYSNAYKYPDKFFDDIEPCIKSEVLYNFINNLRKKGIKMYCLSGMKFSFHLKAKQFFVNKYYGDDIEVISTTSQETKVGGVKIIQKLNNCKLKEILCIDDNKNTINILNQNGINSILVTNLEI